MDKSNMSNSVYQHQFLLFTSTHKMNSISQYLVLVHENVYSETPVIMILFVTASGQHFNDNLLNKRIKRT